MKSPKYLLLLLSLAVGLGGCQKEDSTQPDAPLEGRWTLETSTVYSYDATGTLVNQQEIPATNGTYMVIAKDSLTYYNPAAFGGNSIKRQGNSFIYSYYHVRIKELAEHRLVLHFKESVVPPNTPSLESEDIYSR